MGKVNRGSARWYGQQNISAINKEFKLIFLFVVKLQLLDSLLNNLHHICQELIAICVNQKERCYGHRSAFENENHPNPTTLSTHVWDLKGKSKNYEVKWMIVINWSYETILYDLMENKFVGDLWKIV